MFNFIYLYLEWIIAITYVGGIVAPLNYRWGMEEAKSAMDVARPVLLAFLFSDYWEDIGTIESYFDANLALTEQPPKFDFNDPKTPFYSSPRFLPPTKVEKCKIADAIISHGCFLRECSVEHSIIGVRSRLDYGVELKAQKKPSKHDFVTYISQFLGHLRVLKKQTGQMKDFTFDQGSQSY